MMTMGQGQQGNGGRSQLAAGMVIRGTIETLGLVEISGTLEGSITAEAVVIEATGKITGTVSAQSVTIRGQVEGEIATGELRILSGAVVLGQVTATTLSVDAGAAVDFDCKMPKSESAT